MKDVYYQPDAVSQGDLLDAVDNIKEDRTPEDLLFQVLVDWGVDLTLPIRRETMQGKTVFFVDEQPCTSSPASTPASPRELVKELARRKPLRVVFRDNGFVCDSREDQRRADLPAQLSPRTTERRRSHREAPRMKLKFKVQPYQTDAVKSVVDCFAGQPLLSGVELPHRPRPRGADERLRRKRLQERRPRSSPTCRCWPTSRRCSGARTCRMSEALKTTPGCDIQPRHRDGDGHRQDLLSTSRRSWS